MQQLKKEVVLITLDEYNQTPISILNHMYRDGWSVDDVDYDLKCVVMSR